MATFVFPSQYTVFGDYGAAIGIGFDEIVRNFGGGYQTRDLTGPTDGLIVLRLRYGTLTATTQLSVQDPENGNAVTSWQAYIWKVFIRRKQDGAAMDVTYPDPATGSTSTDKFMFQDSEMTLEQVDYLLASTGIVLVQFVPLV